MTSSGRLGIERNRKEFKRWRKNACERGAAQDIRGRVVCSSASSRAAIPNAVRRRQPRYPADGGGAARKRPHDRRRQQRLWWLCRTPTWQCQPPIGPSCNPSGGDHPARANPAAAAATSLNCVEALPEEAASRWGETKKATAVQGTRNGQCRHRLLRLPYWIWHRRWPYGDALDSRGRPAPRTPLRRLAATVREANPALRFDAQR